MLTIQKFNEIVKFIEEGVESSFTDAREEIEELMLKGVKKALEHQSKSLKAHVVEILKDSDLVALSIDDEFKSDIFDKLRKMPLEKLEHGLKLVFPEDF